jgi:hypothetical protein
MVLPQKNTQQAPAFAPYSLALFILAIKIEFWGSWHFGNLFIVSLNILWKLLLSKAASCKI